MIIESIVLAIFICSLGGVSLILIKKIPAINSLPQNGSSGIKEHRLVVGFGEKIKAVINAFEKQIFLHKILSFMKVLTLKVETRVDQLLHKLRQRNKSK